MRTPIDPRRSDVALTVASPAEAPEADPIAGRVPYLPWLVAGIAWTFGALLVGWLAVGVIAAAAWLTAVRTTAAEVFTTIGQGWLAAHGVPVRLGGAALDLTPLGITVLILAATGLAAHHAAHQYELPASATAARAWTAWASVVGACVGTYSLAALLLASVVGTPGQIGDALAGAVAVSVLGAAPGAALGLGLDPTRDLPTWARRLVPAAGVGLGVLVAGSAVALVVALVSHADAVRAAQALLAPDPVGAVLLVLVQLAYLPTWLLWAGAYALGAGVHLGSGAVVAPGHVTGGVIPAVPVLGGVPTVGAPTDWAWLAVGVAAGAAAGWWHARRGGGAWVDGAWQGALTGLLAGLVWVAASWFAVGGLGENRLALVGPRFPELLLFATLPLAAAGAIAGCLTRLWRDRRAPDAADVPTG